MKNRGICGSLALSALLISFSCTLPTGLIAQGTKKPVPSPNKESDERLKELVTWFKIVLPNEEPVIAEGKNIVILTPKTSGKRAQEWIALAEKHRELAIQTLDLDESDTQEAKLGIFLWANPDQFKTYLRRVEKRSPEKGDLVEINSGDWVLRAATTVGSVKDGLLSDHRAGELAAAMMVGRKAKKANKIPEWLVLGFGRATTWKIAKQTLKPLVEERRKVALLSKKWNGWQVLCGDAHGPEAPAMQASAVYYLAFGPTASKFPKFVEGYQLDDNNTTRSLDQVLEFSGVEKDTFSTGWQKWAVR